MKWPSSLVMAASDFGKPTDSLFNVDRLSACLMFITKSFESTHPPQLETRSSFRSPPLASEKKEKVAQRTGFAVSASEVSLVHEGRCLTNAVAVAVATSSHEALRVRQFTKRDIQ